MKLVHTTFTLIVVIFLFIVTTSSSIAREHAAEHNRMGSHGMVLFTDGINLYANHLPLYRKPHDYQLIYRVNTNQKQNIIDYLQADTRQSTDNYLTNMLTILPEPFDLNRLVNQQPLAIAATVFKGHFERGGKEWLKGIQFEFVQMLVNKQITVAPSTDKTKAHQWLVKELALTTGKLFIHSINEKPSFDAIVIGKNCPITLNNLILSQPLEKKSPLLLKTPCKQQSILYYETQDFSE